MLLRTGELSLSDYFAMLKARPPRGPGLAGLMIDGFILVETLKKDAEETDPVPVRR